MSFDEVEKIEQRRPRLNVSLRLNSVAQYIADAFAIGRMYNDGLPDDIRTQALRDIEVEASHFHRAACQSESMTTDTELSIVEPLAAQIIPINNHPDFSYHRTSYPM